MRPCATIFGNRVQPNCFRHDLCNNTDTDVFVR
jgi:hypothetical protein